MKILNDTDKMPFGMYKEKGTLMQDVPAKYLHYLWTHGLEHETKTNNVADYIKRNLDALMKEYPDGIW